MAHDHAHGAVVEALRPVEAEEGRLEDARGEDDLVLEGRVVSVDGGRGHPPLVLFHLLVQLLQILGQHPLVEVEIILEVIIRDIQLVIFLLKRGVVDNVVGEPDHVGYLLCLFLRLFPGLVVHPVSLHKPPLEGLSDQLDHLLGLRLGALIKSLIDKLSPDGESENIVNIRDALSPPLLSDVCSCQRLL